MVGYSRHETCKDCSIRITDNATYCKGCAQKHSKRWKGGSTITYKGYRMVLKLDHPCANSKGYVREHRVVMERMIGRLLTANEIVHHKDGNRLNNRPENLLLMTVSRHNSMEHKARWARIDHKEMGKRISEGIIKARR